MFYYLRARSGLRNQEKQENIRGFRKTAGKNRLHISFFKEKRILLINK